MTSNFSIPLGFDAEYRTTISANIAKTGHLCLVGGTGSGKSMATLYFLYKLLGKKIPLELYLGDFKKSGDYNKISHNFAEFDAVVDLVDTFYDIFEHTPENFYGLKFLILDEYAGFITWLTQKDKKKSEEIRGKISNILMLGRSRHCFVWCIQQRISASLFLSGIGAIDNFQICVGLGRLSPESRRSLFAGEFPDETPFMSGFQPRTGTGLILIDGQPIRPFALPTIPSKESLVKLCQKLGQDAKIM